MTRCAHTVWRVLDRLDRSWTPVEKSWRLNERHYGALQGLNKDAAARMMGEETVRLWRKSFSGIPLADAEAAAQLRRDLRYRLQHGQRIMYFSEQVFLTQFKTGPDELQPDRIVDHSWIAPLGGKGAYRVWEDDGQG